MEQVPEAFTSCRYKSTLNSSTLDSTSKTESKWVGAVDPALREDRRFVEGFACHAAEHLNEQYVTVIYLPWTSETPQTGVFSPDASTGLLDTVQVKAALSGKNGVLTCCTYKHQEEVDAAHKIIKQLRDLTGTIMIILAAHLVPQADAAYSRETFESELRTHEMVMNSGVDDALLDPETEPSQLRLRVHVAHHTWETNKEQMEGTEVEPTTPEDMEQLEKQLSDLLWRHIPNELMPHFKKLQVDLKETDEGVGNYKYARKLKSRLGTVWEAHHQEENTRVAVKVIEKAPILLPSEVEGINREYRFLKSFTSHPNIVKALDFLHSEKNIYIITEYAGDQHLAQHLAELPGLRMEKDIALHVFWQLVDALAHCHSKDISHRDITLEHVILSVGEDGLLFVKLVDFHSAMVAKSGVTSRSVCSSLPCMAPEMLGNNTYIPAMADSWSAGVVLLESTGGTGCFLRALRMSPARAEFLPSADGPERLEAVATIHNCFSTRAGVQQALSCMGGEARKDVVDVLAVLVIEATARMSIIEMKQLQPSAPYDSRPQPLASTAQPDTATAPPQPLASTAQPDTATAPQPLAT